MPQHAMINGHEITQHADARIRQRGLRDADLALLLSAATAVAPDAYLLTAADAEREIRRRKREIEQIERLRGCKVVVDGGTIISVYRSRPSDQRRTFRRGRERQ